MDKAVILLGLGHDALRRIEADAGFRMRPAALAAAIDDDKRRGIQPMAVVATASGGVPNRLTAAGSAFLDALVDAAQARSSAA